MDENTERTPQPQDPADDGASRPIQGHASREDATVGVIQGDASPKNPR